MAASYTSPNGGDGEVINAVEDVEYVLASRLAWASVSETIRSCPSTLASRRLWSMSP